MDRRSFVKTVSLIGLSTIPLTAKSKPGTSKPSDKKEFKAILVDITRCEGCQSCEYACLEANGNPDFEPDDFEVNVERKTSVDQLTVINAYETSKGEVYVKKQCMHCNQPACVAACLTNAMEKTKEGPVIWHADKCMGCRFCMVSCPFHIPKFEYESNNPRIRKCTMCADRLKEGELPACVENCPNEALVFGTRRELLEEAKRRIYQNPDDYHHEIYGEDVVGGTSYLYISPVPFEELGFNTELETEALPKTTTGFLHGVPVIETLLPPFLLGIAAAAKWKSKKTEEVEDEE